MVNGDFARELTASKARRKLEVRSRARQDRKDAGLKLSSTQIKTAKQKAQAVTDAAYRESKQSKSLVEFIGGD